MVLKLTFSVDYEDAHPHVLEQCALGLALPLPKITHPFPPNSPIIYIYICIWVLRFYFTHSDITKTLKKHL